MAPRVKQEPNPTQPNTGGGTGSSSLDDWLKNNPPPAGSPPTTAQYRAPIGVGYQTNETGADILLYDDGHVEQYDGKATVPADARVVHAGQVLTTRDGAPIAYSASAQIPVPLPDSRVAAGDTTQLSVPGYQPAQYLEGDDWRIYGSLPVEVQVQVKQAMIDRGIISSKNVSLNDAVAGLKQVLAYANASGQAWNTALQSMPLATVNKTRPRNAYNIQLSSPTDLAAVFRKAAGDLLGGGSVPQSEIDKYVNAYQQMERDEQAAQIHASEENANANAGITQPFVPAGAVAGGPGADQAMPEPSMAPVIGTSTKAPSASDFANEMIRKDLGGQTNKYAMLQTYNTFMDLVSKGIR